MHDYNRYSGGFFFLMILGCYGIYWFFAMTNFKAQIYSIFWTAFFINLAWLSQMFCALSTVAIEMMWKS
jgi:hypothetical protein